MKKKFLFLASLAILALGACNNETDVPQPGDEGAKAKGYLSIGLSAPPSASPRTTGGTTENGSIAENTINNVTIVLTDAAGNVAHVKTPTITNGVTDPFDIILGTYKVYALVNSPIQAADITVGQPIQRVVTVAAEAEAANGFGTGGFFMVNAKHDKDTDAGVAVTITADNTPTSPAKAKVFVDRVSVKIEDNTADKTKTSVPGLPAGATSVELEGFVLLNMNKKFNLIQSWNNNNVLETPLPSYADLNNLPKDQYFYHYDQYVTLTKDANGKITEIEDLTKGDLYTFSTVYTTENRPTILTYDTNKLTAGRGETTGVIYKAVTDNATTFYVYDGTTYPNFALLNAAHPEDLTSLENDPAQLRGKGVKVYEDGVMYYTYYIKDNNPNYQYNNQDYYGVFRNSIYRLNVNKISKIGDDVPGGSTVDPNPGPGTTDPTGPTNPPIDADEAYIEVTVDVNPWVLNLIDIEF